jgi:DnaJ family protein C protein 17
MSRHSVMNIVPSSRGGCDLTSLFSFVGPLDTTVRLKYSLTTHPTLTTAAALSSLLASFGPTDSGSIVLSLKPPKKAPHKPPKYGTALVPFEQIGDAFSAVCASGRSKSGLEGIEVGWAEGKEPQILGWLRMMGKLNTPAIPQETPSAPSNEDMKAHMPQAQVKPGNSPFSSFPESFVSLLSLSLFPLLRSLFA